MCRKVLLYCYISIVRSVFLHLDILKHSIFCYIFSFIGCGNAAGSYALLYYCVVESENHAKDIGVLDLKTCLKFMHTRIHR